MNSLPRQFLFNGFLSFILPCGLFLVSANNAHAVTVPDDYSTIQAALDDVRLGDLPSGEIIQVRPGVYNEALTFASPDKSFYLLALGSANDTIIDATGISGPAVFIHDTPTETNIDGFTITGGNNTGPGGGGLFLQRATVNLANCIIEGNYGPQGGGVHYFAANSIIENSTIRENVATKAGGGIAVVKGSSVSIVDTEVLDNVAGVGDYLANGGGIRVSNSEAVISGSTVSGNSAKFAGGGIFVIGGFDDPFGITKLTVEDTQVSNNQVIHDPGGPLTSGGGIHIEANSIAFIAESTIVDNISSGKGGGLNTFQARYEIVGTRIEFNHAIGGSGGGIYGFSQSPSSSSVLLLDSVVRNNSALNAGGVSVIGNGCGTTGVCANLEVDHSFVGRNNAVSYAGGIGVSNATVSISGSQVFDNQSTGGLDSGGGGIRIVNSTADVNTTNIIGNYAANSGGGIFVGPDNNITVDRSIIYSNYVDEQDKGGGVQTSSSGPPSGVISNTVISDNSGFQVREESCPPNLPSPILSYHENTISDYAVNALYKSPCAPTNEVYDIDVFNALSPGLKTINNVDTEPAFSVLTMIPLKGGRHVVTWAQAGAAQVEIINLGSFPGTHGSVDVFPACSTSFALGADMVSVIGTGADMLEVSNQLIRGAEIIEATQSIDATNVTIGTGADVTFRAGSFVSLGPSFTIEAGSTFRVQIDPDICL